MNGQLSFIDTLARLAANPGSEVLRADLADLAAEQSPASSQLHQFVREMLSHTGPIIHLEQDGRVIGTFHLGLGGQQASQLQPGNYLLRLSTGRVLWEDTLTESDLFRSIPDQSLPLAAASEARQPPISCEELLAGGAVVLKVIPGFHGGTIGIEQGEEQA